MALNKEIDICEKISSEVKNTFLQIYNALKNRETQLLRQIEVLSQHYKLNESYDKCFKQVTIIFDNERDVLTSIANFGRIDFNGLSSGSDFYKIEDYQIPERDHVSLYKYIENSYSEQLNKSNNVRLDSFKLKQLFEEREDTDDSINKDLIDIHDTDKSILNSSDDILQCTADNNSQAGLVEEYCLESVLTSISNCDINYDSVNNITRCIVDKEFVPNLNCECDKNTSVTVDKCSSDSTLTNFNEHISTNDIDKPNISDTVRKLSMKQPVQVQQWMEQIISEPEVEPAPTNVMEHSHISVVHKHAV